MPLQTQDAVLSPPLSPLLTEVQAAERELAMYAAIIGHRPTVQPPDAQENHPTQTDPHPVSLTLHTFHLDSTELKAWVSGWVKQMSQQAKRRIDEAKMRLAG